MRVEKTGTAFRGLTIHIEQLDEAEYLWHILNCGSGTSLNEYCQRFTDRAKVGGGGVQTRMWQALNEEFKPSDYNRG